MASWDILPGTHWRLCTVCCCTRRFDHGVCMYDPASPIAKLVKRDVCQPWLAAALDAHRDAGLMAGSPNPPNGGRNRRPPGGH